MFEGQPCLISRALPGSCEQESKWAYMQYHLLHITKKPRLLDFPSSPEEEESDGGGGDGSRALGRDISINCLLHCSSSTGCGSRMGSSSTGSTSPATSWNGRPSTPRRRWFHLPRMPQPNECFVWSDKESLAVGTELLVFGKEVTSHIVLRYSILSNTWSPGAEMNNPRCLFGSASLGGIAIVAGGCSVQGTIYNSAELYNSETQKWTTPQHAHAEEDVLGGVHGQEVLHGKLAAHPQHVPRPGGARGAPPLVAVVNDELYAADYAEKALRKYDKSSNLWIKLGICPRGPSRSTAGGSPSGPAATDQLLDPQGRAPRVELIDRKPSGGFVYNCAVMGC
ncbi:unnamed protein product [Spirodela intermedia]|uniref:Uncharacterized protein n=1 Tax=Spirodela intermedia TaxID=51605 RepID=A0A7I8J376_SPIIN|nr:unnamed protein product [Spirodela intermedia]CAA6664499.1 unnamed protein product [Spirodela intermedia]